MASPPTPGPFVCAPGFYQVIAGQLNQLNPVTGTYTAIGPTQPLYNAMGYDPNDNYLYALSSDASNKGDLLRIANDGSLTDLGLPAGLPPSTGYVSGGFDDVGNLIIRSSATTWYSINVTTKVATTLTITGVGDAGNDLVWIGGIAYLMSGTGPTTLYAVNLSTKVATSANVTGITGAGGSFGAAWSDSPDDLFFSDNSSGQIFLIKGFTTGSPTASLLVDGQSASTNDGAACKLAANPFEAPTANADSYSTAYNTTLTVNAATGVLANDVGAGISVTSSTAAGDGTVAVASNGSFTYTPTAGATGPDTFTYTVTDGFNRTSTATVSVHVALPAAPVAIDDAYSVTANGSLTELAAGGVLANDTGTSPSVSAHTNPAHGIATVNADGSFTYTPTAGYSGIDTIPYTITDAFSQTASAIATFAVHPIAQDTSASGTGPGAIFTAAPPSPVGVGPFTYALASAPPAGDGVAVMNPSSGQMQFTPAFGFHGIVPNFTYTVTDAALVVSAPANITFTVNEPGLPVAGNDAYTITADGTLTVLAANGLLVNDTGPGITESGITAAPAGTVHVNADGSFVYSPVAGFSGADNFTYALTDEYNRTTTATVTITVDPVALDVTGSGTGPGAIHLTPATPVGTGPFAFHLVTYPSVADGTATINASTGVITFLPAAGFTGAVPLFTYAVTDGADNPSAPANVSINVALPAAPLAVADTYSLNADGSLTNAAASGVLANDTGTSPFVSAHTNPVHGIATVNADGSFTYTPTAGYSGADSIAYTITDAFGRMSSSTATFTVHPTTVDIIASGTGPGAIDTAPSPAAVGVGPFTYTLVSAPSSLVGVAVMDPNSGQLVFTPALGFSGIVPTFTYTVTDAASDVSAPANISLTVNEPAQPVAGNDAYTIAADGMLTVLTANGLLVNDTGPGITESGITAAPAGTVHVNPDGSFVYSPVAGFSGTDTFTYALTDEYNRTTTATVTITVDPVALDITGSGTGPGAIHLTPATPVGTGPFAFHLVTTPSVADGTATINAATGVITFLPAAGFTGAVPLFTYAVTDGAGNPSAAADIDMSVGTPTPPTTSSLSGTTPANQAITVTPATPTGTGPFAFALATTPAAGDGVATIDSSTGAVTFTPALDFSGIVLPFTYTVTDAYSQASVPENVAIDVTPLAEAASGVGAAGAPITVQPPAPVGVGPFTYAIVAGSLPAGDGTVSIDATTGAITFTPAPGFSGSVTVRYTVTDADGLVSAPSDVMFDVAAAAVVTATPTAVPATGAVETSMLGGGLLVGMGLLLMAFGALRRRRRAHLG